MVNTEKKYKARPGVTLQVDGKRQFLVSKKLKLMANETTVFFWDCLADWTTVDEMVAQAMEEFDIDDEVALKADIQRLLSTFLRADMVMEEGVSGWLKRVAERSYRSFLAPALSPLFMGICSLEYHFFNLLWTLKGARKPTAEEVELVRKNVTFIAKSFERQKMAQGLCRNISRMYPGVSIIIADDSKEPLKIEGENVEVVHLPFNSGLSAGLKAALERVKTPYVFRMDDDELLTVRSLVHREVAYLESHPELDLIGLGYTTAIRCHSPKFFISTYYDQSMSDALRPLKIPHMTQIDENHLVLGKVANIYLARTEKVREVGFDPNIRMIDHHDFFWRAAGVMASAMAMDTVVFHRHNPYDRKYFKFRNDYKNDLSYIGKKHRDMRIKKSAPF